MSDELALLRLKSIACLQLADTAEDEHRRSLWIERARHWEQVAANAAEQGRRQKPDQVLGRSRLTASFIRYATRSELNDISWGLNEDQSGRFDVQKHD